MSRYTVGIDLGTTNSVIAYIDQEEEHPVPRAMLVPQAVAPGEFQSLYSLPSFIYLPLDSELGKGAFLLPWEKKEGQYVVGTYAQTRGAEAPSRVVFSSKSWLCCERIDRHSPCLPLEATADEPKISPVDAARIILGHLRDAWNYSMAGDDEELRLEKQSLIITVPASFDAVARELTVEAAQQLGLRFTLLEEPQAAFYSWLAEHDKDWRNIISNGDVILVCDIGGGTTDFSLIIAMDMGGELQIQRLAVGEHTLLGGDNMDITLAMSIASKLMREKKLQLTQYQITALIHACRRAKEALGNGAKGAQPITLLGRGSSLMGGTVKTSVSEGDLRNALLEGFFPECGIDADLLPERRGGLRSFSLDYASDPAFTHHLAHFLNLHSFKDGDGKPMLPSIVLFNGGVTKAPIFSGRLVNILQNWRGENSAPCRVLQQAEPDLAVAKGAAWYGHVTQCGGIRIKAGSARSYYIGVEAPMPAIPGFVPPLEALCVVSHGMEEGTEERIGERGMALVIGEASDFRLFSSTLRLEDKIGQRLKGWEDGELVELPSLTVSLPIDVEKGEHPGSLVPITLRTVLTDIGTLQLWGDEVGGERHWKLEFELRGNEVAGV